MAARKSADATGVRSVKAVFVKEPFDGGSKSKFFRQPFNIVIYEWGNGERSTFIELCPGNRFRSLGEQGECYDDLVVISPAELAAFPRIGFTSKYTR